MREVVRTLPLLGSEIQVLRIEQVTAEKHNAGVADLVTVRAVRMDAVLFSQIQTLLRFRGQVILFGANPSAEDLPRGLEVEDVGPADHKFAVLRRTGL